MSKPILLLQIRPEDSTSDGEYQAILTFGNLSVDEVVRVRLEQMDMPEFHLDDYSAIIIGGGPWNPGDPIEKQSDAQKRTEAKLFPFVKQIVDADKPCLAICYGLEAIACATHTPLTHEFSESAGAINLFMTEDGTQDPLLTDLPNPFRGFVGHHESLAAAPAGATLLLKSETCPVEMFRLGQNVYATQFHPEMDVAVMNVRIDVYKDAGYFPPGGAERLKEKIKDEHITIPMMVLKRFVETYHT